MAKVKITGHASGSGVLTITAPNTSTDRTVTLPDSTGTLLDTTSGLDATKLSGNLPAISAASLTNVPKDVTVGGRKNMLINGGFDVWQRGTSLAGASKFLADRWFNTSTETQSRQTFTVGQTDVPHNPTYYHRGTSGSSEFYERRQAIENVAITAGREVTLSYWMKGSSAFTNAPYSTQDFGTSGSSDVAAALSTASITTSWARYSHTFTPPSISGKTVGASNYLLLSVLRANITNITVEMANVQFEFGSVATDFEQRSYGEELALCQRYYQQFGHASVEQPIGAGVFNDATQILAFFPYLKEMRAIPTTSVSSNGFVRAYSGYSGSKISTGGTVIDGITATSARLNVDFSSSTAGQGAFLQIVAGQYIYLNAEL